MSGGIVTLSIVVPLALALCWCVPRLRAACGVMAPWAALPALLAALAVAPGSTIRFDWLLFGTVLGLDELTRVFLGFTAVLWLGAGIHARGYLADDPHRGRFDLLWLMTMTGNFGLILSRDVASFYAFFALMTFAAYGLVIHDRKAESLRAGRVYLAMAVIGEGLIIAGLLMAASLTATSLMPMLADLPAAISTAEHRDLIVACLWLGFGIKAGLPLLHMWLPLAHPVAPVPASAVLSGAMIKAGLLGWMTTLPLGVANLELWGNVVICTGFVAAFGAAMVGVNQRTPKTVLAYSSISQMGLITVGIGAGLHSPLLWPALAPVIALYALHHGLAKGALFLGVGIAHNPGPRIQVWLWALLALPGLALAGLMPSGMIAKLGLKGTLYAADAVPGWWAQLPLLLGLAAMGTTALVARYLWLLRDQSHGGTAAGSVWLGWGAILAVSLLAPLVLPVGNWGGKWPASLADAFDLAWPVAVGGLLSLAAWRWWRAWPIPSGDVLTWVVQLLEWWAVAGRTAVGRISIVRDRLAFALSALAERVIRRSGRGEQIEHFWRREAALVFAILLVGLALFL